MAVLAFTIWNSGPTRPASVTGPAGRAVSWEEEIKDARRIHRVLQKGEPEVVELIVAARCSSVKGAGEIRRLQHRLAQSSPRWLRHHRGITCFLIKQDRLDYRLHVAANTGAVVVKLRR